MARKKINRKKLVKPIHLFAILFIVVYSIVAKYLYFRALYHTNLVTTYIIPYVFGVSATLVFLFLFSHADFFHFVKEIEKTEDKKERAFLKKFLHYGKILATVFIGVVGGPVFLALTIRILLKRFTHKYLLIFFTILVAVAVSVGLVKQVISLFV